MAGRIDPYVTSGMTGAQQAALGAVQADLSTAQAAILALESALEYATVSIPALSTTYNAAAPVGWVNGKPVRCNIANATTNPVCVIGARVAGGNLQIELGGCNGGLTGDPGAGGADIDVWQDQR